jgi:multiple sugar transport system substrate-binding protein
VKRLTRRDSIKLGAGVVAGASLLGPGRAFAQYATSDVAPPDLPIEDGASLRVLRPSKFVQGDETLFLENTKKFTEQTGVDVRVDSESWEDLRPKTAVAANVGSGPDIVLAWSDDPHQFEGTTLELTDIAEYLGKKYGGWYPLAERSGRGSEGGPWIAMPIGASGGRVVYRKSWVNEAGYDSIPGDLDGFLELCRKLQQNGHPPGLALGNAVGDANAWCKWVVWTHGGYLADEEDNVTINSPETIEALKYAKALYETFIPGTLSWLDPSNNKAFLAGEIGLTQNGISIYYAAKNSEDPAVRELAEDIHHARMPIGPVGMPTERCLMVNSMVFDYTPYPNAAKQYLRFMMEQDQYAPWLEACIGYWNHPLQAYEDHPIWTSDPKHEVYATVIRDSLWDGYKGSLGEASAATLAEFVIVQMVAAACAGQLTPEEAAAEAERRAKRYYES